MTRLAKYVGAAALVAFMAGSTGCKPNKGTANPEDYFPLIIVALDGGKTAAMIGRNEFLTEKNFAGCVSTEVLIAGFDASGDVLAGKLNDLIVVPALELDLAECLALREGEDAPEGAPDVAPIIEAIAGIALSTGELYASKLKTANCKKGTAALGVITYLKELIGPISAQVAEPGSPISIPAVTIPLSECE